MNPEIEQLKRELAALRAEFDALKSTTTIPWDIQEALKDRLIRGLVSDTDFPDGLASAPLTAITAPSGGGTVDSQARTAINSIITALENLGLVDPN